MTSESSIESAVSRHAKTLGMEQRKYVSPQFRSVPDRIFFAYPAFCFFIEFKAPGKKPTSGQIREMKRLMKQGFAVFIIDNTKLGKQLLNEIHGALLSGSWDGIDQIKERFGPAF